MDGYKLMKRLSLILLLLLIASPAYSWMGVINSGGSVPVGAYTCPSGTYLSAWDGDYNGDTDKLCVNNGSSSKDGTVSGGLTLSESYGETGVGARYNGAYQTMYWTNSSNDIFNDAEGTVCISIKPLSTWDTSTNVLYYYINASNRISCSVASTRALQIKYGSTSTHTFATQVTADTYNRVCYAFSASTDEIAVRLNGGAWETYGQTMSDMTDADVVYLANDTASTETIQFDRMVILNSYKASDPGF